MNTLLYKKYLSHTLFLKGWCFLYVRDEAGDGDRLLYWPQVLFNHNSFFFSHLGWVAQPWVTEGLAGKLVHSLASSLQLTPTNSNRPGYLDILLSHVHLLPLFIRLFTQVHLLIDSSVEGHYISTMSSLWCKVLCIVISFLVLGFICWTSSIVHFKNGCEYLKMESLGVFPLD